MQTSGSAPRPSVRRGCRAFLDNPVVLKLLAGSQPLTPPYLCPSNAWSELSVEDLSGRRPRSRVGLRYPISRTRCSPSPSVYRYASGHLRNDAFPTLPVRSRFNDWCVPTRRSSRLSSCTWWPFWTRESALAKPSVARRCPSETRSAGGMDGWPATPTSVEAARCFRPLAGAAPRAEWVVSSPGREGGFAQLLRLTRWATRPSSAGLRRLVGVVNSKFTPNV